MFLNITLLVTSLLFAYGLFFYVFQDTFIFRNGSALPRNAKFPIQTSFQELFLPTSDKKEINAVHLTSTPSKGVVLFFHGNKGNLMKWSYRASYFLQYKYDVFIMDYRGYGKSTGAFNENSMYEDALQAYAHLLKQYSEKQIVVYGFSLGCTFATRVASVNSPKEVILEAPFFNLKKAVLFISPLVPTFLLKYQFRTDLDLPIVTSPITIFHGDQDKRTSFEASKRLFALNLVSEKEFVCVSTATHHNISTFPEYKRKLTTLLER